MGSLIVPDLLGEFYLRCDERNDEPLALAKASVGIVMGAIGSDVALETADVALMRDDISKVSYLVDLGRKTMRVVRQNIAASILVREH